MKIAVTYDNGNVFQHFGKTENSKFNEVEDNKVISSEGDRFQWQRTLVPWPDFWQNRGLMY